MMTPLMTMMDARQDARVELLLDGIVTPILLLTALLSAETG